MSNKKSSKKSKGKSSKKSSSGKSKEEKKKRLVLWFDEIDSNDVDIVGGKNASLGEMYRNLKKKGVNVPNGFTVTAYAYKRLLEETGADKKIQEILEGLDASSVKNLYSRGKKIRKLVRELEFPEDLKEAIRDAYKKLEKEYKDDVDVAVRSSATAEDLPDASFAGQQETYLNIQGPKEVIEATKKCIASLFTNRAISYREDKDFDHFKVYLSVGIQKMVRSDKSSSGVMFSIDTETGFRNSVFITGAYGLGENVVQGKINPDEWYVFKPTLKEGKKPIISKKIGSKEKKMVYTHDSNNPVKDVEVPKEDRKKLCISDEEVLELAKMAVKVEEHYSNLAGEFKPMDIEWAKDGESGELFIVQARPETVHSQKDMNVVKTYKMKEKGKTIIKGKSVGDLIGSGKANIIKDVEDISKFKEGQVLVTEMTDPDWEPIMKKAAAIVTNSGGRTCHAAIVSRELGIPAIVGTGEATEEIKQGQEVTVDCTQGDAGFVYDGKLEYEVKENKLDKIPKTKTKIMMNIATPGEAFKQSFLPNSGVGLAREEFIINSYIKAHPLALLNFKDLEDKDAKKEIEKITKGYKDKSQFFIDKLAQGIAMITAAFYPKPVIVRLSDFKSNEYANLIGGEEFEPKENNPMLGWRGASRYYSKDYKEAFGLECEAIKKVREEMGLTNLEIMIPFMRTVKETKEVLKVMEECGLKRGKNDLKIIGMCEIPSNVLLAEEFLELVDGFSIGTNDLTQLALGVDRDSSLISHIYDERDEAVKQLVEKVIKAANKKNKYIGICGQAPSDYPEFARFVVESGIKTMSLNPDTIIQTTLDVAKLEKKLGKSKKG